VDSVVIDMDPHSHPVMIEVVDERERVLHKGRYCTDADGNRQMLAIAKRFSRRRWAVEGCNGVGRHGPGARSPMETGRPCLMGSTRTGWIGGRVR
jgi:hypothetical protein